MTVRNIAPQASCPPDFSIVPLLYLVVITVLACSAAYTVALYLSWWVALPIGIALAVSFSALVKVAFAPRGQFSAAWRIACALAALFIFGITVGLNNATMYSRFIAQTSAVEYVQKVGVAALRHLEARHADAAGALKSVKALSEYSEAMAKLEEKEGGSCPARPSSARKRGPIAIFRAQEAAVSAQMHDGLSAAVEELNAMLVPVRGSVPATYAEAQTWMRDLNVAIDKSQALAHGAFVRSARESLVDGRRAMITSTSGETFDCGDRARDQLIDRAVAGFSSLERSAPIAHVAPAIDLANPHAVGIRSLLRSFNFELMLLTFGLGGQFEGDPLMVAALKRGLINDETISLLLAALLEFTVVVFAMLMSRRGAPVFPFSPQDIAATIDGVVSRQQGLRRVAMMFVTGAMKAILNMFWSHPPGRNPGFVDAADYPFADGSDARLNPEVAYPDRELEWGTWLAPYMVTVNDGDYAYMPAGGDPKATMAARSLLYRGALRLLTDRAPLALLARYNPSAASRLERLIPDARARDWEVYTIQPHFSQALRSHLLA